MPCVSNHEASKFNTNHTSIRRAGHDANFRGEGAMHRAFIGDFEQFACAGRHRAGPRGRWRRSIWSSMPSLVSHSAQSSRMDLAVPQCHRGAFERKRFPVRIKPHGHGRAGAEPREHEIIGSGSGILAAGGNGLIRQQMMRADRHRVLEFAGAGLAHHDLRGACRLTRRHLPPRRDRRSASPRPR